MRTEVVLHVGEETGSHHDINKVLINININEDVAAMQYDV